jgi:hypothetical protein
VIYIVETFKQGAPHKRQRVTVGCERLARYHLRRAMLAASGWHPPEELDCWPELLRDQLRFTREAEATAACTFERDVAVVLRARRAH